MDSVKLGELAVLEVHHGPFSCVTHASTHPEPTPQPTSSEHERGWKAPGVVQSLDRALLAGGQGELGGFNVGKAIVNHPQIQDIWYKPSKLARFSARDEPQSLGLSWDCESAWGTTQAIPVAP